MKISIIFLQIYLLSVACSPNLDYRTGALMAVAVESNSAEEVKIGSIGGMKVLYPEDSYTVSGSTYSDTTTATINGVPAESYAAPNGEIVVLIPDNLKNGRLNIEVSNSNDSLKIDNVFHLNDPSIPLFSGSASQMCSSIEFYNGLVDAIGLKFSGVPAWLTWLFAPTMYLVGFKNRFVVLFQWAWSYLSFKKGSGLIIDREWRTHTKKDGAAKESLLQ